MQRKLQGLIVSDKMDKTRVVLVERLKKHSKYLKYFKVSRKFKAHDEDNTYKNGDRVIIAECRPMSKDKRWRIIERLEEVELNQISEDSSN